MRRPVRPGRTRRSATRSCTSTRSPTRRRAPSTTPGSACCTATSRSKARTPSFSYIVPDRCHDGNPAPCAPGAPAGMAPAGAFLERVVPEILASAAYKSAGLLVITVDEAPSSGEFADSSSCCGAPSYPNVTAPSGVGPRRRNGRRAAAVAVREGRRDQPGTVQPLLAAAHDRGHLLAQAPRLRRAGGGQADRSRRCSRRPPRTDRRPTPSAPGAARGASRPPVRHRPARGR